MIECIILHINEDILIVEIYDESLNHLDSIILADLNQAGVNIRLANCIHLKNEIGVYTYYPFNCLSPLYIQINKLVFDGSHYILENVIVNENTFQITTSNDNEFDHGMISINSESLIKINDNKFSYAYIIILKLLL